MTDVDLLLADLDVPADDELARLLVELQDLGTGPVPAPSAEVAALLTASGAAPRSGRRRRGVVIGALVLASIGTGATAAAADPGIRAGAADAVAAVVHVVQPHAAPAPHHEPTSDHAAEVRHPAPVVARPVDVPTSAATTAPDDTTRSSGAAEDAAARGAGSGSSHRFDSGRSIEHRESGGGTSRSGTGRGSHDDGAEQGAGSGTGEDDSVGSDSGTGSGGSSADDSRGGDGGGSGGSGHGGSSDGGSSDDGGSDD